MVRNSYSRQKPRRMESNLLRYFATPCFPHPGTLQYPKLLHLSAFVQPYLQDDVSAQKDIVMHDLFRTWWQI